MILQRKNINDSFYSIASNLDDFPLLYYVFISTDKKTYIVQEKRVTIILSDVHTDVYIPLLV